MTELENEKTSVEEQPVEAETPDVVTEEIADAADGALAEAYADDEPAGENASDAEGEPVEEIAEQPVANNDTVVEPKQKTGIGDLVIIGILSLIMVVLMCLPSFMGGSSAQSSGYDLSDGTAVTVNGVAIGEKDVASDIMRFRTAQNLVAEDDWGRWMAQAGYTTETLRQEVIESFVAREVVNQAVAEYEIEVSDEEIDARMASTAESVGGDERLAELLAQEGATVDEYRQSVASGLRQEALAHKVITSTDPVDDQMLLDYLKMYYPDEVNQDAKSLDEVDAQKVDEMRTLLEESLLEQAYIEWMSDRQAKADVQINPMPENLPYDVDVQKYQAEVDSMNEMVLDDYADEAAYADAEGAEEDGDVVEVLADDEQAEAEE